MRSKSNKNDPFIIVGIGASAGGLQVLKQFVSSLPERGGMAYIIIQHLSPDFDSMLSELLAKESDLPVQDAEDNQAVEPDQVYVIPPDTFLELEEETIKLTQPQNTRGSRKAIDHFFRSLAQERGDACAGIILSGAGGDGTAGLRAIKAAGGLALAQEPEEAEHPSMPTSAIEANVVDKVSGVDEMVELISRFAEHPMTQKVQTEKDDEEAPSTQSLRAITEILKTHENFNLDLYKPTTIQRRISRRMSLTDTLNYQDYLQKLRDNDDERKQLTKDLLINVTDFFRDRDAFDILENKVIPDILDSIKDQKEDIRVWVPGCASGEEAYSIAMLMLEARKKRRMTNDIKIFATDVDEHAIKNARRGLYTDSIAREVPEEYLERYFIKLEHDHRYKINSQVRDLISFAVQNLATDPPFNHMHLISCRNLLIYLNRDMQQKVLSSFYFALDEDSYLFLGSSESLGSKARLFKTTSKKWRIYQKIPGQQERKAQLSHLHIRQEAKKSDGSGPRFNQRQGRESSISRSERMRLSIMEAATLPSVLVDEEGRVLYSHGDLSAFLDFPQGEPRYELSQVVKPALRTRVRSALYKVNNTKEKVSFHCSIQNTEDDTEPLNVIVKITPVKPGYVDGYAYTVVFTKDQALTHELKESLSKNDENTAYTELERELSETREELQNTIEELETSTEELKASHEEALSTNEELQSSNEELEASSEELRSLNEELRTVNAQLKDKIEELKRANDDAENFFASTNLPTVFLDPDLQIKRYTPAAEHLLKMGPRDIDRNISSLGRDLVDDNLTEECREVLRTFQPKRKEVKDYHGRWFIRQLTPYRTEDRRVDGVVLVFQDVTELKELTRRAETREHQQAVVARLGILALSGTKPEELMRQAVRQVAHTLKVDFCKVLKYQAAQNNFLLKAGVGWQEGLTGQATVPADQNSQAGYTMLTQEPVIVRKLSEEKRFSGPALLTDHDIVSGISCLINHSDPPYGILAVHTTRERAFTKDDANFLLSVATMLSTAIKTRESQKLIFESEEKFRTMANSIPQLAWMTDETGYIFWYNQRWYDFTGTTHDEMKGWGWQQVHHPDHVERVVHHIKECFANGTVWEDTFPLRSKDGEYRWFLSRAVPIRDQEGNIRNWFGTNTDITEKLAQEEALRQSEERLMLAKNSSRLGMFVYNIVDDSIDWEPFLREIWGVDEDKIITLETFFEGLHPEDVDSTQRALNRSLDPGGDGHYEVTYRVINRKNKKLHWIKASGTVLFEDGVPQSMIGLVDDITEQKQLELSLQQAVRQLEEADEKKNNLLSILGHELRNPLASLSVSLELIESKLSKEDRVFRIMKNSVGTMGRLLDDLLDLNRVTQNTVDLDNEIIDIKDILENVVQNAEDICAKKDQKIELASEKDLTVAGDKTRLEQIFTNLIVNASKYTPQAGNIRILAKKQDETVEIQVIDNGVGMSENMLDKIFEPFYQLEQEGKAMQGLGIGLALVKKLVEQHGGKVTAYSEGLNQGSTFVVYLPARKPVQKSEKNKQPPLAMQSGLRVLLIDDNEDILLIMPRRLEALGCNVETAGLGEQGLAKTSSFEPDVILVDIGLPDMSGHELGKKIRELGFTGLMVAVSGYSHKEAREKSTAVGFDHHLAKPVSTDDLVTIISSSKKE